MLVLWLIHFPLRNAAIVDAGWTGGIALCALIYAALGTGWPQRAWGIAILASIWAVRLGGYLLFTRVLGHPEEGRYVALRQKWKTNIGLKFLIFYQVQAITCGILSLPFLLAAANPEPSWGPFESAGIGLFWVGFLGETLADWQLLHFKKNPANRGKTCRAGLWNWSRHPNYFFESLVWLGFATYALGSPQGYWAFLSPAIILYLLFRVTGIPATEAQAVRTKGADYLEYQRTVSAFVPWPPKQRAS